MQSKKIKQIAIEIEKYSENGLNKLLEDGWVVKFATPLKNADGKIEYILEKEID